jgi:hypothetical protein
MSAAVAGLALTARYAASAPVRIPGTSLPGISSAPASSDVQRLRPDSLAALIVSRDPFRISRQPATVPFDPDGAARGGAPPVQPPQRPAFVLAGVVLGEEPAALVDGLPGVEGTRVMRVGERVGDYVLRAVSAERAVLAGPDTVWTLRVRSHFQ